MPATRSGRVRRTSALLALLIALLTVAAGLGHALPGGGGQATGLPPHAGLPGSALGPPGADSGYQRPPSGHIGP